MLVVFGHVIMGIRKWGGIPTFEYPLEKFIWTFHVSLFFFLSGYVYKITQKWKSKGTRTRFIAYKFIKVAVPYFSISIFYILINSLTAKTNTSFSVTDIFSLWKTPVAQYWYIYALFMLLLLILHHFPNPRTRPFCRPSSWMEHYTIRLSQVERLWRGLSGIWKLTCFLI